MKRKIYEELLNWKNNTDNIKPLMILGVRQSGKTYIINEFCQKEYKHYIYVNLLEQSDIVELYNSELSSEEKFLQLKIMLKADLELENTILFIDEIQESEKIISELKFFCEKHNKIRIVCAGSLLGVKLKRNKSSFPVGKVKILNMYPMNFEEFLQAFNEDMLISLIKECFIKNKPMAVPLHQKALRLYRKYLITGGMPECVQNMVNTNGDYILYDTSILKNILTSYFNDMNKYVTGEVESLKINRVYNSLPTQLANNSKKFQYSVITKNARSRDYETALDWLEASNMVIKSNAVSNPLIPLEGFKLNDTFKLYLSDVGILNSILKLNIVDILSDNISLYKGVIAENFVANELVTKGYSLYYWKNNNEAEVDFLLYNEDGIIPVEVKANDNVQSKSLKIYIEKYNPKYAIRISTKPFSYDKKNKIKSVPLYATFLL